jgi:myb proto-oncogene protein
MARTGKWTADEDKKLKDAVPAQGAKNWNDITLLVPGRTLKQCRKKWRDTLDPSISRATARAVKWTADEDKK